MVAVATPDDLFSPAGRLADSSPLDVSGSVRIGHSAGRWSLIALLGDALTAYWRALAFADSAPPSAHYRDDLCAERCGHRAAPACRSHVRVRLDGHGRGSDRSHPPRVCNLRDRLVRNPGGRVRLRIRRH